jgi:molybdopterin synthase sulfur carrier subunit
MNSGSLSSKPDAPGPPEGEITVRVKFLAHFRDIFGAKERAVRLPSGSSIDQLLRHLGDTPERRRELLTGEELNAQVVVLKNGTPIRDMKGLETELTHGDTVAIFPFLAGG